MRLRTILPIAAGIVGVLSAGAWLLAAGNDLGDGRSAGPPAALSSSQADAPEPPTTLSSQPDAPEPPAAPGIVDSLRQRLVEASYSGASLFQMLDEKGEGKVTPADLADFSKKVMAADKKGKGYVTREDAMADARGILWRRMFRAFAAKYDSDNDRDVTPKELGKDYEAYSDLDVDGDGRITADDFRIISDVASLDVKELNETRTRPAASSRAARQTQGETLMAPAPEASAASTPRLEEGTVIAPGGVSETGGGSPRGSAPSEEIVGGLKVEPSAPESLPRIELPPPHNTAVDTFSNQRIIVGPEVEKPLKSAAWPHTPPHKIEGEPLRAPGRSGIIVTPAPRPGAGGIVAGHAPGGQEIPASQGEAGTLGGSSSARRESVEGRRFEGFFFAPNWDADLQNNWTNDRDNFWVVHESGY